MNSACDWGASDPLAVPKTAALMAKLGIDEDAIRRVPYATPLRLMVYPVNEGGRLA